MIELAGYAVGEVIAQSPPILICRAVRQADGVAVIAKVLDVAFPTPLQLARLRHEFEVMRGLDHPGVIKAHALERVGHSLAIVMEDSGGVPLSTMIWDNALSLDDKLRVAVRLSEIVEHIHAQGIVHKDINPNNILLRPDSADVQLIDFGNASALSHEDSPLRTPDHLEGTLAYIAPEQTGRMNRPVDYRADFYSLGITLYELFLGELPFQAADGMELVHMHMAAVPPSLHGRDPSIPPAVSAIVAKLIAKNAEDRYQSAAGLRLDLRACLDGGVDGGFVPGRHDVLDRFTVPARLYGRDAEVAQLMAAYDEASRGQPGVVLVKGYSGIGKSALINEIHRPIGERGGFFISGKFDQYRRNIPYSSLIQAFQDLLHQILAGSEDSVAAWRERLLGALGGNGQVLIEVLPDLRHILGPQPDLPPLAPQEARNRFNLYFINFIRVFADAGHPLVLFLDDLQWADIPSLGLLELLAADPDCRHLLILGAYRSNEADDTHPLILARGRMVTAGATVRDIALDRLGADAVRSIVADTVCRPVEQAQALAELIERKTDGNPFFIGQLLKTLHGDGLIAYDAAARAWGWDVARIDTVGICDNVAELMSAKLRTLPERTWRLLRIAACLGNRFTLHELSLVAEADWDAVAAAIRPALGAELITPIGDEYRFFGGSSAVKAGEFAVRYRFLHDRIQQAAYDLLGDDDKLSTHFKAGRMLLRATPEDRLDEALFDIVDHFNQALPLATDPDLRHRLTGLNLRAAVKAKASIAYEPALKYIKTARTLLDGQPDDGRLFQVLLEQAECEHLNGNGGAAENLYRQSLNRARDDMDKASVYEALVHYYTNTGQFRPAYDTGRQALKLFGVALPAAFTPPLFLADLLQAKWRLRNREIADLIDLPPCRDARLVTAMRLIGALLKAAYQIRPELCVASAVKAVNLSLVHGTTEDNAVAYLVFGGIFLGGVMGDRQAGHEFGRLALAMNGRFDTVKQRSEINFVAGYFTKVWLEPAAAAEELYRVAYDSGLQTGDFFHLSCAACTLVESQFLRGVPLADVEALGRDHQAFMDRIKSFEASGAISATLRAIANLRGEAEPDDEAAFVERLRGFTSLHFAHFHFVNKLRTLYLWGRHDEALEMARQSEGYLKHSVAMLHTAEHHFLHALTLCAVHRRGRGRAPLRRARAILARLERWAALNPANFRHKALLLRAEIDGLAGKQWSAAELYNKAIRAAGENGFLQDAALANELAGRFFISWNVDVAARGHLREAYYGYQMWGATGIADKLALEFPFAGGGDADRETLAPGPKRSLRRHSTTHTSSSSGGRANLDLETVIKATSAISGEIKLRSLLRTLVRIMIENAGAETGRFIRIDQGRMLIEAEGAVGRDDVLAEGVPLDGDKMPVSVIQYVARVGESVVLSDSRDDRRFWNDPYIKAKAPKSLLCAPVVHHGQVVGIIYLENNLTSDAFTTGRLEMLAILSAQAAISLENSLLYDSLEQRVRERTEQLRAANEVLERLTFTDPLTQVSNKRHFQAVFDEEWKRATRSGTPIAMALIDIDHFKLFNDTYGHVIGDDCLKRVAGALGGVITRAGDLLARFGGEEFAVILPNADADSAEAVAWRLVENVREQAIPHKASATSDRVTISVGVADMVPRRDQNPTELIEAADKALYRAKTSGRNRVCGADVGVAAL